MESLEETSLTKLRTTLRGTLYRYGQLRSRKLLQSDSEFRQLVEEVADEAICLGRVRMHSYDPERGPLVHWLYLLGRKLLSRELDRLFRVLRVVEDQVAEVSSGVDYGDDGTADFRQLLERDALGRALSELPSEQRQVLGLFYVAGLSLEETGTVLGKSQHAVSSLLQRARKNARERIEGLPRPKRGRPPKGSKDHVLFQ